MNANMNHVIEPTRWPTPPFPFRIGCARIASALVRTAPLLAVCALPMLGVRWSSQRENAMRTEIHQRMTAQAATYRNHAAARSDLLRGLLPGRRFPQPQWRDVEGRTLPVGMGTPALVLFVDRALSNPLMREIRQVTAHCPQAQLVIVAAEKTSIIREYGRAAGASRVYLVADPLERWHEWYGATRGRAFFLDGRGSIVRVLAASADLDRTKFSSVLKQIGG